MIAWLDSQSALAIFGAFLALSLVLHLVAVWIDARQAQRRADLDRKAWDVLMAAAKAGPEDIARQGGA